jgi:hypothetical protein
MKQITSFEHACQVLGLDPLALPEVSMLPENHQKAIVSHYKLITIVEANNKENGDWKADWNNSKQWKYYPWFWVKASDEKPAGSGLSFGDFGDGISRTPVGSRLCVGSSEQAEYVGKTFIDLYTDYFLIQE